MKSHVQNRITQLDSLNLSELRDEYYLLFGEVPYSANHRFLRRRIAWRIQVLHEGGLNKAFHDRAKKLADGLDLRVTEPRHPTAPANKKPAKRDPRLPQPGTLIQKIYKGRLYEVTVLKSGFRFADKRYKSLSAVANAITGSHLNGFRFFCLNNQGGR